MPRKVEIIAQTKLFQRLFFHFYEVVLRHERYAGDMSQPLTRLHLERGAGAAAVVHDPAQNAILLVEQFRAPTYFAGDPGWLLELPAGMIDGDETPEATIRREIVEETGYAVVAVEPVTRFYLSPGGSTEHIHLFYVVVDAAQPPVSGGGLADEGEDIRVVWLPMAEIAQRIADGTIHDARTLVGLQWFLLAKR